MIQLLYRLCYAQLKCSRYHLSPYNAITTSLTILSTLYLLFPWLLQSIAGSLNFSKLFTCLNKPGFHITVLVARNYFILPSIVLQKVSVPSSSLIVFIRLTISSNFLVIINTQYPHQCKIHWFHSQCCSHICL